MSDQRSKTLNRLLDQLEENAVKMARASNDKLPAFGKKRKELRERIHELLLEAEHGQ